MPSTTISRGNIIANFVFAPVLTPVSVGAATSAEQSFTLLGLQVGDIVQITANVAQTAGITIGNARVSAANTLTVSFGNATAGGVIPAAGAYLIEVNRPESLPLPTSAV